jgi:hypothetical protein
MKSVAWLCLLLSFSCSNGDRSLGETRSKPDPMPIVEPDPPEPEPGPGPTPSPQPCELHERPAECAPAALPCPHNYEPITLAGFECGPNQQCCGEQSVGCGPPPAVCGGSSSGPVLPPGGFGGGGAPGDAAGSGGAE